MFRLPSALCCPLILVLLAVSERGSQAAEWQPTRPRRMPAAPRVADSRSSPDALPAETEVDVQQFRREASERLDPVFDDVPATAPRKRLASNATYSMSAQDQGPAPPDPDYGSLAPDNGSMAGNFDPGMNSPDAFNSINEGLNDVTSWAMYNMPNMYGDFFVPGGTLSIVSSDTLSVNLPVAGGSNYLNAAENNKPLTQDRVYFLYNSYAQATTVTSSFIGGSTTVSRSAVSRATVGLEKTFAHMLWSAELRLPLVTDVATTGAAELGNVGVLLKRMLYEDQQRAVVGGVGFNLPTSSDLQGVGGLSDFHYRSRAVGIVPYLGYARTVSERLFWQGFLQANFFAGQDRVDWGTFSADLQPGILFNVDLHGGYWFLPPSQDPNRIAFAGVLELHYATAQQGPQFVQASSSPSMGGFSSVSGTGHLDSFNLVAGLHLQLASETSFRLGLGLPLATGANRTFESEVQVQLERRF